MNLRTCFLLSTVIAASVACTPAPTSPTDAGVADGNDGAVVDDVPPVDVQVPPPGPFQPTDPRLRRLTRAQYTNAIRDVFDETLIVPRSLEPDKRPEGSSSIGGTETTISQRGTEQYQDAAYDLAEQILRNPTRRARYVTCTAAGVRDDACAGTFLRTIGRKLWRRPVTDAELATLVAISGRAAEALMDFHRGLEFGLSALLQSPNFLFREEMGTVRGVERRYERYELASRLSFFLWNGPPDDALLDAAEMDQLQGDSLATQVDRMLQSPKLRRGLEAFVTDWLRLDELDFIARDATLFPSFGADFGPSAREEVLRTISWIVLEQNADFRDVLTTRESFVNRRLASIYGVTFPSRGAGPNQFERITYSPTQPRQGILGMAAFLALEAHPTSTSPTLRGKYVRELILCEAVPPPPVGVNTAIPEPNPNARTLRERLQVHQEVTTCRGCHRFLDNIGLGFENFDALGRFRREDNGAVIDPSGFIDTTPFADPSSMAQALRNHPGFPRCVVNRLYRHAWGFKEEEAQREEIERLSRSFAQDGFHLRGLLRTIALGEAFRRARAIEIPPLPPLPIPDGGAPDAQSDAGRDASATDAGATDANNTDSSADAGTEADR
ncbi:MAG: DUF1592 domain-containing protein [Myxococcales bacterium]|nr:DUF1592 domain-containing protein [Myxococcales bacterium]